MQLFLCPECLNTWTVDDMTNTDGACPELGNSCNQEDSLQSLTPHQYMAHRFVLAGYAKLGIGWDDLETYLNIKKQKTFPYKGSRLKVDINRWERFCAFVYYKITGKDHPGSVAMGRGFRSQEFGEIVAKAILEAEDEAG